jgi:hypothetical protein
VFFPWILCVRIFNHALFNNRVSADRSIDGIAYAECCVATLDPSGSSSFVVILELINVIPMALNSSCLDRVDMFANCSLLRTGRSNP